MQDVEDKRLTEIFNKLSDKRVRPELLAAIKANKRARERLGEMIEGGGGNAMFVCMIAWLREQLAAR